jgi:Cys-tRNA(Pro) deacylase
MHRNALRFLEAADALGLELEPREFPESTHTAADAAAAIGVPVGAIVKSLVFGVDDTIVVALVSGSNQLDEHRLAAAAGGKEAHRVDAETVRTATGYPVGGVPPFGHATPLPVYVDEDLLGHEVVWAAAGTPNLNFSIPSATLVEAAKGTVLPLRRA